MGQCVRRGLATRRLLGPVLLLLGWPGTPLLAGAPDGLPPADPLAEAREALAKADYDTATSLLTALIAQLEPGAERGEAKELLGDCHLAAGRWQDAITPLAEAADEEPARAADILPKLIEAQEALPVGVARLDALWRRGTLEARVAGPEAARATYETALAEHDDALRAFWEVADVRPYAKARREADRPLFRASLRRVMARLLAEQGQRDAAGGEWQAALLTCPAYGAEEVSCRELGRLLREERPTEALAYLLRSLSYLGDRASGDTAVALPANERALEAVAPHTEEFLGGLFADLEAVARQFPEVDFPDEPALGDLLSEWRTADELSHTRDFAAAFGAWLGIAEGREGTLVANMAHLAAAECAFDAGHYELAAAEFPAAQSDGAIGPAINPLVLYGRGHAALAEGRTQVARACFEAVLQADDVGLQALARLRLAECLEMLGDAPGAQQHFQVFRNQHPDEYLAHMAREGLKRLDQYDLSELRRPADERRALYLGEDRQTRGRWRTYGRDAFILCAANGLTDLCGGTRSPLPFKAYLGTGEKVWWWTQLQDPHTSMLYNPCKGYSAPTNWDDGGEKQPVGTGPDLFLDLDIPPGLFRLSLYFVNDHNYYEPNREYTVYLIDRASRGKVVAACPVRHFLHGVYEHFAIAGPCRLTVRVFRNLSLNTILSAVFLDEVGGLPLWEDVAGDLRHDALDATSETVSALRRAKQGADGDDAAQAQWGRLLTVGAAVEASGHATEALSGLSPWGRAAFAWSTFRYAADSGCGRGYETQWLSECYHSVQRAGDGKSARQWLDSLSTQLLESGYVGFAQMVDVMAYPPDRPDTPYQSVTVPVALAARYSEIVDFWEVPNRGMPPKTSVRRAPLDQRLALSYIEEALRRLWGEQADRAKHLTLVLAEKYRKAKWPWLARRSYEAVIGDERQLSELTPEQHWNYALTLPEGPDRIPVLEALLQRDELPRREVFLRGELLWLYLKTQQIEAADAEARRLLALDADPGYKHYRLYHMALVSREANDFARAAEWCHVILHRFPDSPVASEAQRMLAEIEQRSTEGQGGR